MTVNNFIINPVGSIVHSLNNLIEYKTCIVLNTSLVLIFL